MPTPFDSGWDAVAAIMDRAVDDSLGDRILYLASAITAFPGMATVEVGALVLARIPAFIIAETVGEAGIDELDDGLAVRRRVKVARRLVALPTLQHRLQHPVLGQGLFRPLGAVPVDQGRYWLFDVQKVA